MPLAVELKKRSSLAQVAAATVPQLVSPQELVCTARDLRSAWSQAAPYVGGKPHNSLEFFPAAQDSKRCAVQCQANVLATYKKLLKMEIDYHSLLKTMPLPDWVPICLIPDSTSPENVVGKLQNLKKKNLGPCRLRTLTNEPKMKNFYLLEPRSTCWTDIAM